MEDPPVIETGLGRAARRPLPRGKRSLTAPMAFASWDATPLGCCPRAGAVGRCALLGLSGQVITGSGQPQRPG